MSPDTWLLPDSDVLPTMKKIVEASQGELMLHVVEAFAYGIGNAIADVIQSSSTDKQAQELREYLSGISHLIEQTAVLRLGNIIKGH